MPGTMVRLRLVLPALAVAAAVFAPSGLAAPYRPGLPDVVTTTHFAVHYTDDTNQSNHITQGQAGDVAGYAESAYSAEVGSWGLPAPPSDAPLGGDGRIDIYVEDLSTDGVSSAIESDPGGINSTDSIDVDAGTGTNASTLAASLLIVIEDGIWRADDSWIYNASSMWAEKAVTGYATDSPYGQPSVSLDCDSAGQNTTHCDSQDPNSDIGWARWPFFEYLAEQYGPGFIANIFKAGAATGLNSTPATTALANALAAKGTSLTAVYTNWAVAAMTGGYSVGVLSSTAPDPDATVQTGTVSGALPVQTISVNHLAAKYVQFVRGTAPLGTLSGEPCNYAALTVTVTPPPGVATTPYFWWSGGNPSGTKKTPLQLTDDGNGHLSTLVAWDTCYWGATGPSGWLVLPNPSTTVDGANFVVSSSLQVFPNIPATATPPPSQVPIVGTTVVAAPTTDVPPDVDLFGPELIRIGRGVSAIRLIVQSSGPGQLSATIGGTTLGTAPLRAGNNDVRFKLPTAMLRRVRTSADASLGILTLTSLSPQGASGAVISRRVLIDVAAARAKAKHKPKRKHG